MPCLQLGHLLSFHIAIKESPKQRPHTESLIWWPWCSQQTPDFLKSVLFDRISNFSFFFFFSQPKQPLWAHTHAHLQCLLAYFCDWLGCGSTAKSKSSDLMLLPCSLLVLLLLVFTLLNKRSHPARLCRAHLRGRQKHFLASGLHTIPKLSPFPPSALLQMI